LKIRPLLKPFAVIAAAGFCVAGIGLVAPDSHAGPETLAGAYADLPAPRVQQLYYQNCARCHGADGRGDTPVGRPLNAPDFTSSEWRSHTTARTLARVITNGRKGMPAFRKKLSRSDITSLASYVRRF
jgi:mono/diheme cytochrome c family protein